VSVPGTENLDVAGTPTFFIDGKKFNDTFGEAR
jgi:protein-disulfide isomerase